MQRVALIGLGKSGSRLLRALIYRERMYKDIKLAAICDSNSERLKTVKLSKIDTQTYTNVDNLLLKDNYDIIIIATNETSHYDILRKIKQYSITFKKVLIEKLLVENFVQASKLSSLYNEEEISVHFVERHSPVVKKFLHWKFINNLRVKRANFLWGKYRLYDHRPTIGVTSEISHPIDLIQVLAGIKSHSPFSILGGNYIHSDFSVSGTRVLDTINVNLKFGEDLVVNGSSSFLWDKRTRKIQLYLSSGDDAVSYMATFIFDTPHWDADSCKIYKVNQSDGKKHLINHWSISQKDIAPDLLCISKIHEFISENIEEVSLGKTSTTLARLSSSCYVQEVLEEINNHSESNSIYTPIYGEKIQNLDKYKEDDLKLIDYFIGNASGYDFLRWDRDN